MDSLAVGKNDEGKGTMHEDCLISLLPVSGVRGKCETAMLSSYVFTTPIPLRMRGNYLADV